MRLDDYSLIRDLKFVGGYFGLHTNVVTNLEKFLYHCFPPYSDIVKIRTDLEYHIFRELVLVSYDVQII
jgi:hypothetical protein